MVGDEVTTVVTVIQALFRRRIDINAGINWMGIDLRKSSDKKHGGDREVHFRRKEAGRDLTVVLYVVYINVNNYIFFFVILLCASSCC